jgi:hypothetical protein
LKGGDIVFGVNTWLADVMSVINQILTLFTSAPIVYFVMLALIGASVGVVKKLIPTKRK